MKIFKTGPGTVKAGNKRDKLEINFNVNNSDVRKFVFWNIAGLLNKDNEWWKYMENFDFISLVETWIEEKDRSIVENILPKDFIWEIIVAKRVNKKGRAMGGVIIGIRKDWQRKILFLGKPIEEGIWLSQVLVEKKKVNIWSVYNRGNLARICDILDKEECNLNDQTIIGGDFNVRIGEKGRNYGLEKLGYRKCKDTVIDNGSKQFTDLTERKGLIILNGFAYGDEEGDFTFIGPRVSTVIDYECKKTKEIVKTLASDKLERVSLALSDSGNLETIRCLKTSDKETLKLAKLENCT